MNPFWWWASAPVAIEEAELDDAPELAAIHGESFPYEWTAEEISALLRDRTVFGMVARRANLFGTRSPVGFILMRSVVGEAEILTIAVSPRQRGRGCGRALIEAAFRRLYRDRVKSVFLEVDGGNQPALTLYGKLGFRQVGERKGYYRAGSTPGASALVMRADLG